MDTVIRICVYFMLLGIGDTKEMKRETYAKGENATVRIDELQINGKKVLEITFSGYTSKLHVTNVMLYDPMKNQPDYTSINVNYTGRIKEIKMSNGNLSLLLVNVSFMDSGNYTVFEDSLEKGKTSIIVPHRILPGRNSGSMILPFMCNKTNISSIKIEMIEPKPFLVVIYDVTRANCTEFGIVYKDRIESCVLSENSFSFTIQKVSWLDRAMYVAWDDNSFLLDSIFVDIQGLETTHSSKFEKENDLSESVTSNVEDELLSTQTVESAGSSTSYARPPPSTDECGLKADIEMKMNGVFAQMFKVEAERLSIERERLRAELERLKVEKERLAFEYEGLGIEKERIEILKSKPTGR